MRSAQRVKKAIEQDGQQCLTIAHDLMQADKAADVVKQHMDKFGKLDILVNNASKQIMSKSITEIEVDLGPFLGLLKANWILQ